MPVGWPVLGGGEVWDMGIAIDTRFAFHVRLLAVGLCTGVVTSLLPAGSAAAAVSAPIGVDVSLLTSQSEDGDTLVSDTFSTHAGNELLVAMFSADGPYDPHDRDNVAVQTIRSVTGCGLTWSQASDQANYAPGVAAVFTAYATSPVSDCQVSGELASSFDGVVAVLSFTGAAPALADVRPVSNHHNSAGYGAVDIPVDGGLVYQVGHNWSAAEQPVRVSGNGTRAYQDPVSASVVGTYLSSKGDTSWVSKIDEPLPGMARGTDTYASIGTWFSEVGYTNAVTISIRPA